VALIADAFDITAVGWFDPTLPTAYRAHNFVPGTTSLIHVEFTRPIFPRTALSLTKWTLIRYRNRRYFLNLVRAYWSYVLIRTTTSVANVGVNTINFSGGDPKLIDLHHVQVAAFSLTNWP